MPTMRYDGVEIYYEEHGDGFPVLTFAPGGMRSAIEFWDKAPFHPARELAGEFRVILMDQRNAGRSRAPVTAGDGWQSYTRDHLALLDHLGIEQCHLLGGCIGGPYCLSLIQAAEDRVASAVLQQTIGFEDNREAFYEMFDGWAKDLQQERPDLDDATLAAFRSNMYDGDFVFGVSREFVRACRTPMLVLMGNDPYHPASISREVAELAPNAELVEHWKEPENVPQTVEGIREFFRRHTP